MFPSDSSVSGWIIHKVKIKTATHIEGKIIAQKLYWPLICMHLWSRMPDCSFKESIPIFSAQYSGDHIWLGDWEWETLWNLQDSFTVHGPWHGLLVSILIGPTCMKLACKYVEQTRYPICDEGVYHAKNSVEANEAGLSQCWESNKIKANLTGTVLLLFQQLPNVGM